MFTTRYYNIQDIDRFDKNSQVTTVSQAKCTTMNILIELFRFLILKMGQNWHVHMEIFCMEFHTHVHTNAIYLLWIDFF